MPNVVIEEKGCRDCRLCIDICPTDVFEHDEARGIALVKIEEDCIGCTSCEYVCPSRCVRVTDAPFQRPFFRIENDADLVKKLLQKDPVDSTVSEEDLNEAVKDVTVRLLALADSVTETMGRGLKSVGRKAGTLAAAHLPEMYEGGTMEEVLQGMQRRFGGAFDFEATVGAGGEVTMRFKKCSIHRVVNEAGGKIGEHVLCSLFHEYWAGLVGTFTGKNFTIEMPEVGTSCTMKLTPR